MPIPVALGSDVYICGHQSSGIVGYEFCYRHRILSLVFCLGSSLRNKLITLSEESYLVFVSNFDLETSTVRQPGPKLGCCVVVQK
jgi:hypothetical protein